MGSLNDAGVHFAPILCGLVVTEIQLPCCTCVVTTLHSRKKQDHDSSKSFRNWPDTRPLRCPPGTLTCHQITSFPFSTRSRQFVTKKLRRWLGNTGAKTFHIEPGSPWENGYCESFISNLRDEFLNGEIFYSFKDLRVLAERWRVHYNTVRPHSSLGYKPPAPEARMTETVLRHGEVETATRFPLPPTATE